MSPWLGGLVDLFRRPTALLVPVGLRPGPYLLFLPKGHVLCWALVGKPSGYSGFLFKTFLLYGGLSGPLATLIPQPRSEARLPLGTHAVVSGEPLVSASSLLPYFRRYRGFTCVSTDTQVVAPGQRGIRGEGVAPWAASSAPGRCLGLGVARSSFMATSFQDSMPPGKLGPRDPSLGEGLLFGFFLFLDTPIGAHPTVLFSV